MCYKNRILLSLIGILLVAFPVFIFGVKEAASAPDIYIAVVGPMTGEASEVGITAEKNVKLMAEQVNSKGGIQGRLIKVQVEDDRFDLKESASIAARLGGDKKVIAVVGPSSSVTCLAAVPIYKRDGLTTISYCATSDRLSGISPYFFRTITMDLPNAKMAAYYIVNILGAKRVAAIYALMDGPITQSRSVMKEVAKLGAKAVREETHMEGDKDYTAQLTKIIAENPDLIFTSNFYTEAGTLIRQARGLGYKGLIMGGDGAYSNELIKIAGKENAEGVMCWAAFHHGSSKPEVQAYVAAYREKYKGENPDTYGACAYAGTGVIVTALQKTIKGGEVDRKRIRDYIAGIGTTNPPYPGVTGMIKFDNNGDVETSLKIAVIRNGDFELAPKQLE